MVFDLIVLGTGGIGSAALYSAAARGTTCLGLDRFPPAHDRGSSHGESRLIRLSYFEHADYVPLLHRSYALWDALDPTLLRRSGVIYFGPEEGVMVGGVLASAAEHGLPIELRAADSETQYKRPQSMAAVFEGEAGWLPVEACVQKHLDAAIAMGATHRWGEAVIDWHVDSQGVCVNTEHNSYQAKALVVAGGAWAAELLSELSLPLRVERKHLHWFRCDDERYRHGFFYELPEAYFYGFPAADGRIKVAEHSGGELIDDPLTASTELCSVDAARIERFVAECLPGVQLERLAHKTCFYTRTPDEHFILDTHPEYPSVAYAAGLSGHGFKFAPAIGEMLVDLALGVMPSTDVSFLSRRRFDST